MSTTLPSTNFGYWLVVYVIVGMLIFAGLLVLVKCMCRAADKHFDKVNGDYENDDTTSDDTGVDENINIHGI